MKILHVVALIQSSTGGPAVSVTRLASEQAKLGHEVTLACLDYPHLGPQVTAEGVRLVSVNGNILAVRGRGWSRKFRQVVIEEAKKADVVHNHGLWMWPNAYAREAAVAAGKPLIISPRGMLESWSLNRSRLRKAVAWRLFEKKNLQAAAMFHATSGEEKCSIEKAISHGLTRINTDLFRAGDTGAKSGSSGKAEGLSIVVAPNGVDLPDLVSRPGRQVLEDTFPELKGRRWVVFMSRLHPKKGIDVLLRAWARQKEVTGDEWRVKSMQTETLVTELLPHRNPVLVLAGSDLIGYRKDVERMVRERGLEGSVVIVGEVLGEAKDCLLANADVFVLPSYSENFGIVVAEAMSWGRPVIASTGTPWKEIADVGAGWWVKPEEGELVKTMQEALGKSQDELDAIGAKSRTLVAERYTWAAPAERLTKAYEEVLASADQKTKRQRDQESKIQESAN